MKRLLFLLLFGLSGTAVLLALGYWQMQRLEWKQALMAEIDARIAAPAQALPAAPDSGRDKYLAVTVDGTILPGELQVLVSRKEIGPGFRIVSPFLTGDGRRILVDRGFVRDADRDGVRALGPATIAGNLHWPQESDSFTPAPDRAANTWFARDVAAMASALDTEPVLLVARTPTDPAIFPLPVDTASIPNDHLQYAITWFSLALIWAAMTAHFLWRTRTRAR